MTETHFSTCADLSSALICQHGLPVSNCTWVSEFSDEVLAEQSEYELAQDSLVCRHGKLKANCVHCN